MASWAAGMEGADGDARLVFPDGFRWGVATSSHQCEGGNTANNWYAWEQAGHIKTGERAGSACDWWQSAERDFDLARDLGLNALRLSVEWSRIEPRPGEWDNAALTRYRQMLVGLHERGIEPMVTLHHFTNPLWFEERGGFLAADAVTRFDRFTERVVTELGDLCDLWCTVNEPNVYAVQGYLFGAFPPGRRGDAFAVLRVQAALARAHAAAYRTIHRIQPAARVGWAQHVNIFDPANPSNRLDRLAAGLQDAAFNDFFLRAVASGRAAFPLSLVAGDLRAVQDTCDYIGVNVYYRDLVAFDPRAPTELFGRRFADPAGARSDQPIGAEWGEVYPDGLRRVALRVAALGRPIYVTENGVADAADRLRPWQLALAARALHAAIAAGADVRGYYHWTLVDNFEWVEGWKTRFGLIALDPQTQARTPRRSAALYGAIAHANAMTPEMLEEYAPSALADVFPAYAAGDASQ